MVESLSNNADKSDVDAEVEQHRSTEVHDQPQPPEGKGQPNGIAELNDNGTVRSGQIPALAISNTFTVTNEADLTGLNAAVGDVGIVTSQATSYILTGDPTVLADWVELQSPAAPVQDVNGQTGSVTLNSADVGAEPAGAVEDHRTTETHATAQPAQVHGNEDHDVTFAQDGDPQPPQSHNNAAHTESYTTAAEAAAAAPVDSVNGQTGAVTVDTGGPNDVWAGSGDAGFWTLDLEPGHSGNLNNDTVSLSASNVFAESFAYSGLVNLAPYTKLVVRWTTGSSSFGSEAKRFYVSPEGGSPTTFERAFVLNERSNRNSDFDTIDIAQYRGDHHLGFSITADGDGDVSLSGEQMFIV